MVYSLLSYLKPDADARDRDTARRAATAIAHLCVTGGYLRNGTTGHRDGRVMGAFTDFASIAVIDIALAIASNDFETIVILSELLHGFYTWSFSLVLDMSLDKVDIAEEVKGENIPWGDLFSEYTKKVN